MLFYSVLYFHSELTWNLESMDGRPAISGPYLSTLSYNSNRGTAMSFRLEGTAKKHDSGRFTIYTVLVSFGLVMCGGR